MSQAEPVGHGKCCGAQALFIPLRSRRFTLLAAAGLAILIAGFHGRSLRVGLFMDDYAHFRQLRECGWSIGELTRACRLEILGGVIEYWAVPEDLTLRFFRPVAFGLMKLAYTAVGWRAAPMHVVSLLWHLAASVLLMLLLRRIGVGPAPAWLVAGFFAIHPGHVATVQWIAAQSELMVTTFLLAAALCYARWRGWGGDERLACPAPAGSRGLAAGAAGGQVANGAGGRMPWAVSSLAFFVLALGCRENAVMFPTVIAAMEFGLPSWRKTARRSGAFWSVMLAVIAGYVAVRSHFLQGAAVPPRPYIVPPSAPDFAPYVFNKLCYYLLGEFFLVPCVPIGGLDYMTSRPWLLYPPAVLLIALLLAVTWRHRRSPALVGPVWLIAMMLPVLPAFESQHHLYLPGVGWALVCGALLQTALESIRGDTGGAAGAHPDDAGPRSSPRGEPAAVRRSAFGTFGVRLALLSFVVVVSFAVFGTLTYGYGLALQTADQVEDRIVSEVVSAPVPIRDGETLYFVNLPIIAPYVRLAIEHESGLRDLRAVVLTWSPRVLGVATPCEIEWTRPATLEARIGRDRWLAGPLGRTIAQLTGRGRPIEPGRSVHRAGVAVELLSADEAGISGLRFVFDHPPEGGRRAGGDRSAASAPANSIGPGGTHVFFGSTQRWAYQTLPPGGR